MPRPIPQAARLVSLALLLHCFAGNGVVVAQPEDERAAQEAQAKQTLEALREEMRALEAAREATKGERIDQTRALREADLALAQVARATREVEDRLAAQQLELAALTRRRAELEQGLQAQRDAVAALLRSAYAVGRHSELRLLFAPERVGTTARLLAYHRFLQRDRAQRIAAIAADIAELARVRAEAESTATALEASRTALVAQQAALDAERLQRRETLARIEGALGDHAVRLATLGKSEKSLLQLLERLRDAIADIPAVLAGSEAFSGLRGRLPWPLGGRLLAGFGSKGADGRAQQGVLIAGDAGARVKSVAHGRVAYADWLQGYGLLAIVDHGDGYMSLYAHNEALLKDVGEWVERGEDVATAGTSGGSVAPGVYFELRKDGRPVDPVRWLVKR